VSQNKGEVIFLTEISQLVPGEDTLDSDDNVGHVRQNEFQQQLSIDGNILMQDDFTGLIEYAHVHCFSMQINAAVVLVLFVIVSHGVLLKNGQLSTKDTILT